MSYIIAHVAFDESGNTYPVNCYRDDVVIGSRVVVKMNDGTFKQAIVDDLNYLNWNCKNNIHCLSSEFDFNKRKFISDSISSHKGFTSDGVLAKFLYANGWAYRKAKAKMYRKSYVNFNKYQTAIILLRKNGIDVQVIDDICKEILYGQSPLSISRSRGVFISQTYRASDKNILMNTKDFSEMFLIGDQRCMEVVKPVRTSKALPQPPIREREESLYSILGGDGGDIYLSDGVWLGSDGGLHDWGR